MKTIKIMLMAAITLFSVTVFAQDSTSHKIKKEKSRKTVYSCPIHPNMVMNKPGQCPICGAQMGLSLKEQMKMETVGRYTCPQHPDIISDKPGKCAKCHSTLALSAKEKMKMETMKTYSCSMHPEVVSDKPGKCSKCGMDLTEVKTTHKH